VIARGGGPGPQDVGHESVDEEESEGQLRTVMPIPEEDSKRDTWIKNEQR